LLAMPRVPAPFPNGKTALRSGSLGKSNHLYGFCDILTPD